MCVKEFIVLNVPQPERHDTKRPGPSTHIPNVTRIHTHTFKQIRPVPPPLSSINTPVNHLHTHHWRFRRCTSLVDLLQVSGCVLVCAFQFNSKLDHMRTHTYSFRQIKTLHFPKPGFQSVWGGVFSFSWQPAVYVTDGVRCSCAINAGRTFHFINTLGVNSLRWFTLFGEF